MKTKLTLFLFVAAALIGESLNAQIDYRRLAPGGLFQVPTFWTPFDPINFPPLFGPGGADDRAIFDLGFTLLNTYTISNVNGVNDQLIVENDSVRLEIADYELMSFGFNGAASIVVGESAGDLGILFLDGAAGAQLDSRSTYLALTSGSTGSIIVDSPDLVWNNSDLAIGTGGIGTLQIRAGNVQSAFSAIGATPGSIGFGTIIGPDSVWDVSGILAVGNFGPAIGTLSIEDGANVSSQEGALGRILNSSEGEATISGDGSEWDIAGQLRIGEQGLGVLTVLEGGRLDTASLNIGATPSGDGTLVVNGVSSELSAFGTVRVGFEGRGTMQVLENAEVFSTAFVIGHQPGSEGTADVTGDGYWFSSGVQIIGREGFGQLDIFSGGEVCCDDQAFIGRLAGSDGEVRVLGSGLWQVKQELVVGGNLNPNPTSGGEARLILNSNGVVDVFEDLIVIASGVVDLQGGGSLSANRIDTVGGGTFNMTGGTLHVDTVPESLTNEGGRLAPGNVPFFSSPIGGTTIDGDYTQQQEASLQIQVQGVGAGTGYDVVTITGDAFIDGCLELELLNNFLPSVTDSFEVVNVTQGTLFGFFNNVGDNERLETEDGTGSFLVRYGITSPDPDKVILSDFQPSFILGDVNGDGLVNLLDVAPFIEVLSNGPFVAAADINQDGQVNLLDVAPFIELLNG